MKILRMLVLAIGFNIFSYAEAAKINSFDVFYPDQYSFKVVVEASGLNAKAAYRIRTESKMSPEQVPAGFKLSKNGYGQLEENDLDKGSFDNGPFDEYPEDNGLFARTVSTKDWQPGAYKLRLQILGRSSSGKAFSLSKIFTINILEGGKIQGVLDYDACTEDSDPVLGVAVDVADNAKHWNSYYNKGKLHDSIKKLADIGVKNFYFRSNPKVLYPNPKALSPESSNGSKKHEQVVKTGQAYDVLGEYIKTCKKYGIKVYFWSAIYDQQLSQLHFPVNSPAAKKYGEFPREDLFFAANRNYYWKHRFADKYPVGMKLKKPVGKIKLFSMYNKPPRVKKKNITIYVGNKTDYPPLKKYQGDFNVSTEKLDKGYALVIDGLNINSGVIKLASNLDKGVPTIKLFDNQSDTKNIWCALYDVDGARIDYLPISGGMTLRRDNELETGIRPHPAATVWDTARRSLILWVGDFDRYLGGAPCYALKEARARRLAAAKEIFTRYPDLAGLVYSMRNHSRPVPNLIEGVGPIEYGFNDAIVEEYKKRYGVNIIEEDYDVQKLLKIRGDFFTEFLQEISTYVHSLGKEFKVQALPDNDKIPVYHFFWSKYTIDNFFQIDKWAQKGYVDTVILLSHFGKWNPNWPEQIKEFHNRLKNTKTKLAFHVKNQYIKKGKDAMPFLDKILTNKDIDEAIIYEELTIYARNQYKWIYDALQKAREQRKQK